MNGLNNIFQIGLAEQIQALPCYAQPLGTQLDLAGGFLSGRIKHCTFFTELITDL